MDSPAVGSGLAKPARGRIKVVVWDLDNTLWDGVLLEGDELVLRPEIESAIRTLDRRGILNSIASRNDPDAALAKVREFGLADLFLCPQIGWQHKSASVHAISRALNLGLDAIAFVDDQDFELAEVGHAHPEVTCVDVKQIGDLLDTDEFTPRFITDESRIRRAMYASGLHRDEAEQEYVGSSGDFLATLDMRFTIAAATVEDLRRAEELTVRTNQLNSTGQTYSYDELAWFAASPDHLLLVTSLADRFGTYGKIGLGLVECGPQVWTIKLLLMSCRVMSRGVGTVLLHHIAGLARDRGVRLQAEFVPTGRNRVMHVTYGFAGFRERDSRDGVLLLENDPAEIQPPPAYLHVQVD